METDEMIVSNDNMLAIVKHLQELAARNEKIKLDLKNTIAMLESSHIEQIKSLLGRAETTSLQTMPQNLSGTRKKSVL